MFRYAISPFYICILFFLLPLMAYSADDSETIYWMTKDKLRCLHEQADNLLIEPTDPVIIILRKECHKTPLDSNLGGYENNRGINPKIDEEAPTLQSKDILVLSHAQLRCFKQEYINWINYKDETVPVHFTNLCILTNKNKS